MIYTKVRGFVTGRNARILTDSNLLNAWGLFCSVAVLSD